MKLISLHVENFGTLSSFDYGFNDNLNMLCEKNGWGKTTFCEFINVMLYGFKRNGNSVSTSLRKKYAPWNKKVYGGNLVIEVDGNKYRIERTFDPIKTTKDTFKVIDLTTNLETEKYSSNIGEEILNIGSESFARSIFIPENSLDFNFDNDIKAKLANLIGGTNDVSSFNKAYEKLEERAKDIKSSKTKGLIFEKKRKLNEIQESIKECDEEISAIEKIESSRKDVKEELEKLEDTKKSLNEKEELYQRYLKNSNNITLMNEYQNKIDENKENIRVLSLKLDPTVTKENLDEVKEKIDLFTKNNIELNSFLSRETSSNYIIRNNLEYPSLEKIKKDVDEYYQEDLTPSPKGMSSTLGVVLIVILLSIAIVGGVLFNISMIGSIVLLVISIVSIIGLTTYLLLNKHKNPASNKSNNKVELDNKLREEFGRFGLFSSNYNSSYLSLVSLVNDAKNYKEKLSEKNIKQATLSEETRIIENDIISYFKGFNLEKTSYLDQYEEVKHLLYQKDYLNEELTNNQNKLIEFKKNNDTKEIVLDFDIEEVRKQRSNIDEQIIQINRDNSSNDVKIDNYYKSYARKQELLENQVDLEEEIHLLEKEYDLTTKTMNYLNEANNSLLAKYVKPMKDGIKKYLDILSSDIKDFEVNIDFDFSILEGGTAREINFLSNGYKHLISLCMRLSLIDCLFIKENPFIVLDDPFSSLDDDKLDLSLKLIKKIAKERQVLYFTCHESRIIK